MKITKFGHCCLLLEICNKRILIDPGRFSDQQNSLTDIDIVLITHEHADHYHSESVEIILKNNQNAVVITNTSVARLLEELGVEAQVLEGRDIAQVTDVALAAYDGEHEEIFGDFGIVQNTGYMVANKFFFPGDAYTVPVEAVDVLALPVAGPWCKISDVITYAKNVKPRVAFPVHDATLSEVGRQVTYPHFKRELEASKIDFTILEIGKSTEF